MYNFCFMGFYFLKSEDVSTCRVEHVYKVMTFVSICITDRFAFQKLMKAG